VNASADSTISEKSADTRVQAVLAAARHHGVRLSVQDLRTCADEVCPSPAVLAAWVNEQGLSAKAMRVGWAGLMKLGDETHRAGPIVVLLRDGGALLLLGADVPKEVVWLQDPDKPGSEPLPVDRLRLSNAWDGEVLLIRRPRGQVEADKPFSLRWLFSLVLQERPMLRDVAAASITLSALTIIPPLLVMQVVDRVVVHHSLNTLALLAVILGITGLYEMLLGYTRRELVQVVSTRVDAKLNLHVFQRLLALPLDYFEKNPAGQINYKLTQVWKVREFLTGKLMGTFLDMFTLAFLLPFLFWIHATLAWIVLGCAGLIAVVIMVFLPALRRVVTKLTTAESVKASVMVETVHGIRTVKSLALEPQRKAE
jgi:subfamily B ATP-binding cassette protein HlyB/CyaB